MDLFTEHYARNERVALDQDIARALAFGADVAEARRARRPGRWACPYNRLGRLLSHRTAAVSATASQAKVRRPAPTT